MNRILGFIIFVIGIGIFYGAFFKLAPWISNQFTNEIIKFLSYIAVAYFGGIAIPIFCIIFGIVIAISD